MPLGSDKEGIVRMRSESEQKHPLDRFIVLFVAITIAVVIWHLSQVIFGHET